MFELFVRVIGLEPTHREALDPKSSVSTNFTTPAFRTANIDNRIKSATIFFFFMVKNTNLLNSDNGLRVCAVAD